MFYTLHLPLPLGEVVLHLDTMRISGFYHYVTGYDLDRNPIHFVMDRFAWIGDVIYEYGYCHIVSYSKGGIVTPCNVYQSLA